MKNPRTLDRYTDRGLDKRGDRRGTVRRTQGGNLEEYLAFMLANDAYAVHIAHIAEILKPLPITEVPRARHDVVGVMSVRGRLVTVLDLKRRFSMASSVPSVLANPSFALGGAMGSHGSSESQSHARTRILLVDAGEELIGFIVDEVLQVFRLKETEIEPASALGGDQPTHITGVGRPAGGPLLVLLDLRPIIGG